MEDGATGKRREKKRSKKGRGEEVGWKRTEYDKVKMEKEECYKRKEEKWSR